MPPSQSVSDHRHTPATNDAMIADYRQEEFQSVLPPHSTPLELAFERVFGGIEHELQRGYLVPKRPHLGQCIATPQLVKDAIHNHTPLPFHLEESPHRFGVAFQDWVDPNTLEHVRQSVLPFLGLSQRLFRLHDDRFSTPHLVLGEAKDGDILSHVSGTLWHDTWVDFRRYTCTQHAPLTLQLHSGNQTHRMACTAHYTSVIQGSGNVIFCTTQATRPPETTAHSFYTLDRYVMTFGEQLGTTVTTFGGTDPTTTGYGFASCRDHEKIFSYGQTANRISSTDIADTSTIAAIDRASIKAITYALLSSVHVRSLLDKSVTSFGQSLSHSATNFGGAVSSTLSVQQGDMALAFSSTASRITNRSHTINTKGN